MIAHVPILKPGTWRLGLNETLEMNEPFSTNFRGNNNKVWLILYAMLSTSGASQHVKKFTASQNGGQAWRTLHTHYFGTDKVDLMASDILSTLTNLHYTGDQANFTLDKYCTAHVKQHNRHAALLEYGVQPLDERVKILHFQEGIKDPTFEPVCSSIIVGKVDGKFQDFDSVMTTYMTFKRAQKGLIPTLRVSAMFTSSGGRCSGAKCGDQDARKKGLPPQSEIDRCTHIEKKCYSKAEYRKFTPAKKAKLWQLYNPGMTPSTGNKTSGKRLADSMDSKIAVLTTAVSSAVSVISSLSNATAKLADPTASETPDTPSSDDISNRSNPALARQAQCPKKSSPQYVLCIL